MRRSVATRCLSFLLCFLLLSGCSAGVVEYDFGWTTRKVSGVLEDAVTGDAVKDGFVVVQEYYGNFVPTEEAETGYTPRARLVRPDSSGRFQLEFDWRASQLELNVVAQGYSTQSLRFQRQLGIGDIRFQVQLVRAPSWSDELVLSVTPLIQNLLLEPHYRLPEPDQLFLGDWLAQQRQDAFE